MANIQQNCHEMLPRLSLIPDMLSAAENCSCSERNNQTSCALRQGTDETTVTTSINKWFGKE